MQIQSTNMLRHRYKALSFEQNQLKKTYFVTTFIKHLLIGALGYSSLLSLLITRTLLASILVSTMVANTCSNTYSDIIYVCRNSGTCVYAIFVVDCNSNNSNTCWFFEKIHSILV